MIWIVLDGTLISVNDTGDDFADFLEVQPTCGIQRFFSHFL